MLTLKFINLLSWVISSSIVYLIASMLSCYVQALVAKRLGDDTGERFGFLSLNPLIYIDMAGFILYLGLGIGWSPTIPINPQKFKGRYKNLELAFTNFSVAIANFICAVLVLFIMVAVFGGLTLSLPKPIVFSHYPELIKVSKDLLERIVIFNMWLTVFNFILSLIRLLMFSLMKTKDFLTHQRYFMIRMIIVFVLIFFLTTPLLHFLLLVIMVIEAVLWKALAAILTLFGILAWYS